MSCSIRAQSGSDRIGDEKSQDVFRTGISDSSYAYTTNPVAHVRSSTGNFAPTLGLAARPDQGPGAGKFRPNRVAQESYIRGLAQRTAYDTACDVIYLPSDIFGTTDGSELFRDVLPLESTRILRSVNPGVEMDSTPYSMRVEQRAMGYNGRSLLDVVDTKLMTLPQESKTYGMRSYGDYPVDAVRRGPDYYQQRSSIRKYA